MSTKSTSLNTQKKQRVTESEKFPYDMFPYRLDHKTEKKVCWFQCQEHLDKYIERHKLTTKDYTVSCKRGFQIISFQKPKPTRKPKAKVAPKPKVVSKPKSKAKPKAKTTPKPKATTKPKPKPKATPAKKVISKNIKLLHAKKILIGFLESGVSLIQFLLILSCKSCKN